MQSGGARGRGIGLFLSRRPSADEDTAAFGTVRMTLSMAFALFATAAGCAAVFLLVTRSYGSGDWLTALAQSGSVRLRGLESSGRGLGFRICRC